MCRLTPIRPVLVITCMLCVYHVSAAESEYSAHFWSLLDTNNSGPALTNLSADRMQISGEVAGVKLGMTMSEVVRVWGKPQIFYSRCGVGPRFDYQNAAMFFDADKLCKIYVRPGNTIVEADPGIPSPTRDSKQHSECYLRFSSLIDINNVGPAITNSLSYGRLVISPGESVAGISLEMSMSEVIERWGKPRLLWGPASGFVRLGYNRASLSFAGDRLKEIWISR